jgi:hypothetical protein
MLTATKTLTRSYTVSLKISYRDPDFGTVTDYTGIEVVVPQGYTPGIGGEISRVEAYAAAEYPGWEITSLSLTDDPDVEF